MKTRRARIAVLWMAMIATTGCDDAPVTWREELKLVDGRTIVATKIERHAHGIHPDGATGLAALETEVRFPDPDNPRKIYIHTVEGASGYLMIDFDGGVPWIVGRAGPGHTTYEGCGEKGYASYITFKWSGSRFERVPYASLPDKFTMPNTVSWNPNDMPAREPISHYRVAGELKALCAATTRGCALERPAAGETPQGCFSGAQSTP